MSAISIDKVLDNHYSATGVDPARLYSVDGADGLTFGQLIAAICIRRGALLEQRAVSRMNMMTQNNGFLEAMSNVCSQLAGDAQYNTIANIPESYTPKNVSRGCTIEDFLEKECGVDFPDNYRTDWSYANRMAVITALKVKMDSANSTSQEDAIELQSLINWRDVTYNASSTQVSRYGQTGMNMANNI